VAKTTTRSGSKPKAQLTGTAKSSVTKTRARTVGKKASELLKKPIVREALTAAVVTAVAKRSARKAAREEVREGAPANAGAALGSTVGTIASEALRSLVSKPPQRPRNGVHRAEVLEANLRRAHLKARPPQRGPIRALGPRLAPQAAEKQRSHPGRRPPANLVRRQERRLRKPARSDRRSDLIS
jgi:hypothetical protein